MIRKSIAILIQAALLATMALAGYTGAVILACYIPALRFLPGYDPDPLGACFALALTLWPATGVLGILSVVFAKPLRMPLLTGLAAVAYPAVMGFLTWTTDSSSHGVLPQCLRRLDDDAVFPINAVLFVVAFVPICIGAVRYLRTIVKKEQPAPARYARGPARP